ncbi:MAG: class I SAM-dependent methyltransferase [bacterium]|nr:class I SAM-dependent methyltransferase [bacterium]
MKKKIFPLLEGYILAGPIRRLTLNPKKTFMPYITEGMKVLDAGCGMGFFTLPMAKLVGETGRVFSVDTHEKMIELLRERAAKAGLAKRITADVCPADAPAFNGNEDLYDIDFALAFAVVHEVPHRETMLANIYNSLKKGGMFLMAEPRGHVSKKYFKGSISLAEKTGFTVLEYPGINLNHAVLFEK